MVVVNIAFHTKLTDGFAHILQFLLPKGHEQRDSVEKFYMSPPLHLNGLELMSSPQGLCPIISDGRLRVLEYCWVSLNRATRNRNTKE